MRFPYLFDCEFIFLADLYLGINDFFAEKKIAPKKKQMEDESEVKEKKVVK